MNRERIVYIGDRDKVRHEWKQQWYTFVHGKAVGVREDFASVLLATNRFVLEDEYGKPIIEVRPEGGTVLLRRWGALGDLLMFRTAVAAFVRTHPGFRPILRCQRRFVSAFAHDPLWSGGLVGHGEALPEVDAAFTFDQVAEQDHRGEHAHRVVLFLRAMDPSIAIEPEDWDFPIPPATKLWVERHLKARGLLPEQREAPLIAVQTRGSTTLKALPDAQGRRLIAKLTEAGYSVLLTEPGEGAAQALAGGNEDVYTLTGRDPLHMIEAMRHVNAAVVMDSGPLWMAHMANCPLVAILGPTRPAERVAAHPGYDRGLARAVCLNELIDCPACFEAAHACGGKFTCMTEQPDWDAALGMVVDEVRSLVSGDVRLPVAASV